MTSAELWAAWRLWMAVGGTVVLIAAGLLITIWLTARRIAAHATRAQRAAEGIRDDTRCLWELASTNEVAEDILRTVEHIEAAGARIVEALHDPAALRRVG
jgi:hypothetical protein